MMTGSLIVEVPAGLSIEREYIIGVVLGDMLGLKYELRVMEPSLACTRIVSPAGDVCVEIADCFFPAFKQAPFSLSTLPSGELPQWRLPEFLQGCTPFSELPVLYGRESSAGGFIEKTAQGYFLGVDVFGAAFVLLTRYEELILEKRDEHGRFPYAQSFVARAGILHRPVVDEYVEVLRQTLRMLWTSIGSWQGQYQVLLSHDVDRLFSPQRRSLLAQLRNSVGDVVRRGDVGLAARRVLACIGTRSMRWRYEPLNTFGYIMKLSEAHGLRSAFYFIPTAGEHPLDGDYDLDAPDVAQLITIIRDRGHEIGLHGSYDSFEDGKKLAHEFERLRKASIRVGMDQRSWGGRQHYLRWSAASSWSDWADAGLDYDSTVGFAEQAGFRCGTCREFPVFDLKRRQALRLTERPLIAMDVSFQSAQYMALGGGQALEVLDQLAETCRFFRGNFTLLWHNTSLISRADKSFYEKALLAVL